MFANPDDLGGLEMLFKIYEPTIQNKSDVAILFTHFTLCIQCRMNCIGLGEENQPPPEHSEEHCALLPDGWNEKTKTYALRYSLQDTIYILAAKEFEKRLIINLTESTSKRSSSISLDIDEQICGVEYNRNKLKTLIPKAELLAERLQKQLIKPLLEPNTETRGTREFGRHVDEDIPTLYQTNLPRNYSSIRNNLAPTPYFGLTDVGRRDLDPLARSDFSGNLFTTDFRDPRGMRPRIYPTTPFSNNRGTNPSFSHLQPPGWGNNDFL
ncbi:proteasome inhibitor PI31 subunit-like isoform X1 [Rhagoletis pomonella]|uniref:proteasome inhibitor PI31 subunit-like isoform X1 n=1 Tax=Rhagoletis pomonella TaxID=28610 RepID=UPI001786C50D|nr:proteasome inhibitor PI31 subunit-like isoform X1 [Rhagoletis pomonella]XP_036331546.1 proteasome inhibitor PI31 subunit-like isoform X1 [Rhagoletis pomonella]